MFYLLTELIFLWLLPLPALQFKNLRFLNWVGISNANLIAPLYRNLSKLNFCTGLL